MNTQPMFTIPMPPDIAAKAERYTALNGVPLDTLILSILRYVLDAETAVKPLVPDVPPQVDPNEPPLTEEEERDFTESYEAYERGDRAQFLTADEFRRRFAAPCIERPAV